MTVDRAEAVAHLRAALESEERKPSRQHTAKDVARVHRAIDAFRVDDFYERALELRDTQDPRWHDLGLHGQVAAAMYEAQRTAAQHPNA